MKTQNQEVQGQETKTRDPSQLNNIWEQQCFLYDEAFCQTRERGDIFSISDQRLGSGLSESHKWKTLFGPPKTTSTNHIEIRRRHIPERVEGREQSQTRPQATIGVEALRFTRIQTEQSQTSEWGLREEAHQEALTGQISAVTEKASDIEGCRIGEHQLQTNKFWR